MAGVAPISPGVAVCIFSLVSAGALNNTKTSSYFHPPSPAIILMKEGLTGKASFLSVILNECEGSHSIDQEILRSTQNDKMLFLIGLKSPDENRTYILSLRMYQRMLPEEAA